MRGSPRVYRLSIKLHSNLHATRIGTLSTTISCTFYAYHTDQEDSHDKEQEQRYELS